MSNFRFIDLFAGVGGFHHALSHPTFGGQCVLAVEIDHDCQAVYRQAFGSTSLTGNIRDITRRPDGSDTPLDMIASMVPDHEVLCAGFPCQPFSKSGAQHGVLDQTRGTLFFDIMAIVRAKRPRFLMLENVPNLVGPRHRETWKTIIQVIRDAGYGVTDGPVILSPHRLPPPLGAPQVRDRVFILAVRDDQVLNESAPLISKRPDLNWHPEQWRIEPFLHPEHPGDGYRLRPVEITWLSAWDAFLKGVPDDRLPGFPIWVDAWVERPSYDESTPRWKVDFLRKNSAFYLEHQAFLDGWLAEAWDDDGMTVRDFPLSRRKFEWQARSIHPERFGRTLWDLLIHLRPSGIRVKAPTYFPALVAITQTPIVASLRRRITPMEASSLQGLPFEPFRRAGMDDQRIYRQLGNAVNVGVVRLAAATLFGYAGEAWGQEVNEKLTRLIA